MGHSLMVRLGQVVKSQRDFIVSNLQQKNKPNHKRFIFFCFIILITDNGHKMSDLTIPIVLFTTMAGYFFSKDSRTARQVEKRGRVEAFEKPNGDTIYQSNQVDAVNREILSRSLENYKKAENPSVTGVLPPLFNTYSVVGSDVMLSPETNNTVLPMNSKQQAAITEFNKTVDVTKSGNNIEVEKRPMFKPIMKFLGTERKYAEFGDTGASVDKQTSLLTGLPIEAHHSNMIPFFGSNVKQNVEKFVNEPLLDLHTGNTSTFRHKQEVGRLFSERPQDIYGTPILTDNVSTDRYVPSLYRQNEKPFDDARVAAPISGTVDNAIRPQYKDVNELRVGNNLKETYEGRTVAGQMGEVRGVQGEFHKRRPDTFYEKGFDHLFRTTGEFTAPKLAEDFSNFKPTARKDYNMEYYGGSSASITGDRQRVSAAQENGSALMQEPKRNNFENDYTRNVVGNKSTNDYGLSGITQYETERATTGVESHLLNVNKSGFGVRTKFSDNAKTTVKETTLNFDNTGNVRTQFDKGIMGAYDMGVSGVDAKTTHKESTIMNNYKGIMNKEDGMGYLVNKYDAKTTGKEIITNNSDYTGIAGNDVKTSTVYSTYDNPEKVRNVAHAKDYRGGASYATESTSRTNYANAETRDTKEIVAQRSRASGPQKFQIRGGREAMGDIKLHENLLLKEREDARDLMNVNLQQVINSKDSIGIKTKVRHDNEPEDTVFADRLQPDLVIGQHNQNPYSIFGTKKN